MDCENTADLLAPYADDALPAEPRRRVEAHLLACKACAWEVQTLLITRARLRGDAPEVVASDAFRARTLARLHADNPHLTGVDSPTADPAQYQLPIRV